MNAKHNRIIKCNGISMTLTLPNILTIARILVIPFFVLCFFFESETSRLLAFTLFAAASITDYLDGYLARKLNQQSALGKMLDPMADKLLVMAALVMMIADQTLNGWHICAALLILAREIFISGLREFLGGQSVSLPVSQMAKWKTAVQMGALGLLLLAPVMGTIATPLLIFGLTLLWAATAMTIVTGYEYYISGINRI